MKKKIKIIICVICLSLMCSVAVAYSQFEETPGAKEFNEVGAGLKEATKNLSVSQVNINEPENPFGSVMGVSVSREYFNFKYASYISNKVDYENPKESAWNSIKKQIWEEKFAKENNIYPSEQEIEDYVNYVRNGYEATSEGKILLKSFCDGIDMTEDEYWEFNKQYEAPLAVTHAKVVEFLEKNKLSMPNIDQIPSEIIDQDYYNSL